MQLKNYQNNTLNVLHKFFEQARICGHKQAYENIVSNPEISHRLGKLKSDYVVWSTIPNTPRVCLKVPTGGGKTIIAAHAIKITGEVWLEREFPVVLWFTPSDTIRQQTAELELADPEIVFEYFDWDLNEYAPYQLNENEFKIARQGNSFTIDIDDHALRYSPAGEEQLSMPFMSIDNWTPENLVRWLDKQLRDSYFSQATMLKWLTNVVSYLTEHRGIKIAELMLAKYALATKLSNKIKDAYVRARVQSHQTSFFTPQARVELNFDNGFEFFDNMYANELLYRGRYKFAKHYLGANNVPNFDGGVDGEEFQCAKAIDTNKNVKYWIRNVAKHPNSFWLPTSTDKFYPDFVAMLNDGRILIVEYKGAHLIDSADTREKKQIGDLWQAKSGGKGLFLMAEKNKDGLTVAEQIEVKINK